jgi:hypothetical protein
VVVAVGVLGCFVGAAGAICADDGGEGACGYCEEDFEGEGQVADEGVAVRGTVDACTANCEADEAGEGAAFYCCAGMGLVLGPVGELVEERTCRMRLHLLL